MTGRGGPRFHWFLPTGGDDSRLDQSSHGVGIRDHRSDAERAAAIASSTHREATLEYLGQVAGAADDLGFESVLTPTGGHCQDAWLVTAALIARTRRLRFLVALRPGLITPALSAQMVATFQQLAQGRLLLNVVAGGSAAEQRGYGDFADKDERYQRAEEFLQVLRLALTGQTYTHRGRHFQIEDGRLNGVPDQVPDVYLGGSSKAAIEVTARQTDVYLSWGEPPNLVAAKLAAVRAAAEQQGRTVRFGIRLHVITRDTADQAWSDAEKLIAGLDDATIAARQRSLGGLESEGQRRMLGLHGGDRNRLLVAPNRGPVRLRLSGRLGLVGPQSHPIDRSSWNAAARRAPSTIRSAGSIVRPAPSGAGTRARNTCRCSTEPPRTRSARTPRGSTGTRRAGTVVKPAPDATSCSLTSQSDERCTTRARPGSPGHTPRPGSPASLRPDTQGCSTRSSTATLSAAASGWAPATATSSAWSAILLVTSSGVSASKGRNGGVRARTARSTAPARNAVTRERVEPVRVTSSMSPRARSSAATRGTSQAPALVKAPSRTGVRSGRSPLSSRPAASSSSSARAARRSRTCPASVSRTPSRRRSQRITPRAVSSEAICRDTADWV